MNENAKNVRFKVQNVAIYAPFWGKVSKFWKCAGVKQLTNIMSELEREWHWEKRAHTKNAF